MAKKKSAMDVGFYEERFFDGAGGMRDRLEQAILSEFDLKQYPLKRTIEEIETGSWFRSNKEQCVVIDLGSSNKELVISNTSVGTYLYVVVYETYKSVGFFKAILNFILGILRIRRGGSDDGDDIFAAQRRRAVCLAADAIVDSACTTLELKLYRAVYPSNKRKVDPERRKKEKRFLIF